MAIFGVNGYWKDSKEDFKGYLVTDQVECPEGFVDDEIFMYEVSKQDLEKWEADCEASDQDFVVTSHWVVL